MKKIRNFNNIKRKAEVFYSNLDRVYCPYFKESINFNSKGLDHIKMKSWNKARNRQDQYIRLKLIKLAPIVVNNSNTLQGYSQAKEFVRKKVNNRWDKILTDVSYYEFIAIIDDIRVRIIIKQIIGGQRYFWSIIFFRVIWF